MRRPAAYAQVSVSQTTRNTKSTANSPYGSSQRSPARAIAGSARTNDDNAFFGTEPMFRRAGFRVIARSSGRRLRRRGRADLGILNLLRLRGGREELFRQKAPADQHERAQDDGQKHVAIVVHKWSLKFRGRGRGLVRPRDGNGIFFSRRASRP